MAMCDTESYPEYTKTCKPDSDSNIFDNPDANSRRWIGHHPGTAFTELQFYPPGWVLWPPGISCDASRWCAALNIDSYSYDPLHNVSNNQACLSTVGIEPVNFAFITKSGTPHAPANSVDATTATFTPNPNTDLFMNSGDVLVVELFDTEAGLHVVIRDLTTGESGSMTASAANTFGQVKFDPGASTCQNIPYDFHPMYSTSSEHTRVPWAAHSYNIAFSDETGHFDYCSAVESEGGPCADPVEADRMYCFDSLASSRVPIGGCVDPDLDFDGPPYRFTWPGTFGNPFEDAEYHPQPLRFTSPLFRSSDSGKWENYDRVAFEADMPVFEASCNPMTGAGCSNPPPGAQFYPIYSTAEVKLADDDHEGARTCVWQIGGPYIPDSTNTFGGNSTAEYGPLLGLTFQEGTEAVTLFADYRRVLEYNPCEATLH
jgi:hypothetical protein